MEPVTVYMDVLFLVNLTVDFFLLLATATVRRLDASRFRLLLGAGAGALYSCAVFFPELNLAFTVCGKLAVSALVTAIAFPLRGLRSFLLTFACFHGASALFAGVMMGLELMLQPSSLLFSNGEVYVDLSAGVLILSAAVAYLLLWMGSRLLRQRGGTYRKLTLSVEGRTVTLSALYDSGNLLTDPLTGASVLVASLRAVSFLLPEEIRPAFASGDLSVLSQSPWGTRVCMIPCTTVTGKGVLPAFRPDRVTVDGKLLARRTVVAVRSEGFGDDYDAILGEIEGA